MAFFKNRTTAKAPPEPVAASAAPPNSVEEIRRRAKHRLIGAALLVLLGVVGFPLLFDSQPRPVALDIPIEIPDKNKVAPLVLGAVTPPEPTASVPPTAEPVASAAPEVAPPVAKAEPKPEPKPETKAAAPATPPAAALATPAAAKPAAVAATVAPASVVPAAASAATPAPAPGGDGAKALALLEGKDAATAAPATPRFVVQVGAFTDAAKLREVRQRLEKAGLKTYTQVVESGGGKRTRVRIGPYASQSEADAVAARVKALELSASVLKM